MVPSHFLLTNHTSSDILGLILLFSPQEHGVATCTVVRERGTLLFEAPVSEVTLGNIYPEEKLSIYLRMQPDIPHLSCDTLCTLLQIHEDYKSADTLFIPQEALTIYKDI